jgi:prepilin-type processing-associated H-X9-DG protein
MIHFACACGRDLRVPDEMAGRQVRCPACQEVQFVPGEPFAGTAPPRAVQPEAPRRRPRLSDDSEERYDGEPLTTSAKAGWSLGLGISSFLCLFITGIPAVILGVLALGEIGRSRGRTGGQGLAVGGIVTGVLGSLLTLAVGLVAVPIFLLVPAVEKVRAAAERTQSSNNLKLMALAMHNYHSTYAHLPPAAGGPGMNNGLSWRVSILPYLGEDVLYKQFNLNEAWDSPHNKKLLTRMPRVYAMPGATDGPGMTRYRVFVGTTAAFAPLRPAGEETHGRRFRDFTDGLSNTILIVEAADLVEWTRPSELVYAPGEALPTLSSLYGAANVAMADGSVHRIGAETRPAELQAMITINGGEPVTPP